MFKYPFVHAGDSLYNKLGIGPDSQKDEIKKAINLYVKLTNQHIKNLVELIDLMKVDGLKNSAGDNKTSENLRQGKDEIKAGLIKAGINLDNPENEIERLREEILKVTSFEPGKADKRDEYDMQFPPAILLRTQYNQPLIYTDKRALFSVLREDLVNFFENTKGLSCYHPSDLSRKDFTSDFRYNEILDN
jgi:hypothetical protein